MSQSTPPSFLSLSSFLLFLLDDTSTPSATTLGPWVQYIILGTEISHAPLSGRVLSWPHWPSATYSHRSSQGSLSALSTGTTRPESWDQRPSTGSSSSNTMWQSTSTTARRAATGVPTAPTSQEDLTRHWSFTVCSDHAISPCFDLTHARVLGI